MAKAKVEHTIEHVELTLTGDEARFLADLLGRVGGHPDMSRRLHQLAISAALRGAGLGPGDGRRVVDLSGYVEVSSGD